MLQILKPANIDWRNKYKGTAEQVIAHAEYRHSRGKSPSMSYWGEKNPRKALAKAIIDYEDKQRRKNEYHELLTKYSNLTEQEVAELVRFEYVVWVESVEDQIRRYYLLQKADNLSAAEKMLANVTPILHQERSKQNVAELCFALYKTWSGFVIHYDGLNFSVSKSMLRMST